MQNGTLSKYTTVTNRRAFSFTCAAFSQPSGVQQSDIFFDYMSYYVRVTRGFTYNKYHTLLFVLNIFKAQYKILSS